MSAKLTQDNVREILALLDASHFDELTIETADLKLHLRRTGAAPAHTEPKPNGGGSAPASNKPAAVRAEGLREVTAPMLGTFYRAPKPGAEAFVSVGTRVTPDTVIGTVEVMKLMNSVAAGVAGVVAEIVAEDGAFVEYGAPLLFVKPE